MSDTAPLDSVCVVGGCGFLGSAIVRGLVAAHSTHVAVLDALRPASPLADVAYHQCDITDAAATAATIATIRPAAIILSAIPKYSAYQDEALFRRVIYEGAKNVIAGAQQAHVSALVYVSSSGVVQNICDVVMGDERMRVLDTRPPALDAYYLAKAHAEQAVLAANDPSKAEGALRTCALRPCTLYGPAEPLYTIPICANAAAGNGNVQIGDGQNVWDYVYVDNLVDALILAARALLRERAAAGPVDAAQRVNGEVFNVTDDEPWPFWRFTRALGAAVGYPVDGTKVWVIPRRVGIGMAWLSEWLTWLVTAGRKTPVMTVHGVRFSTIQQTFSVAKAKARLGYRPRVGMEEGIRRTAEWYREEHGREKKKA